MNRTASTSRSPPETVARPAPRVLYSGTTGIYLRERWLRLREYTSGLQGVHMTDHYLRALSYAKERASEFSAKPVVLVINTGYLSSPLKYDPLDSEHYLAERLNPGSFFAMPAVSPVSRTDQAAWNMIRGYTFLNQDLSPTCSQFYSLPPRWLF